MYFTSVPCWFEPMTHCLLGKIFCFNHQAIHEQVPISGTTLTLDYFSQHAPGQQSHLTVKLTPPSLPQYLEMVHVSVSLEGRIFQEVLLPEEGMEYTLTWDGRNVYGQMVYGRAIAIGKDLDLC